MRLKSKTFLVIGGALCAFGAIFCAIILAIGQFDFMKVISVEKYEDKVYTLPAGALTALKMCIRDRYTPIAAKNQLLPAGFRLLPKSPHP